MDDYRPKVSTSWFTNEKIRSLEREHQQKLAAFRAARIRRQNLNLDDSDVEDEVPLPSEEQVNDILHHTALLRARRCAQLALRRLSAAGFQRNWMHDPAADHDWTETGWSTTEWAEMNGYMTVAVGPTGDIEESDDPYWRVRQSARNHQDRASAQPPLAPKNVPSRLRRRQQRLFATSSIGGELDLLELESLAVTLTPTAPTNDRLRNPHPQRRAAVSDESDASMSP